MVKVSKIIFEKIIFDSKLAHILPIETYKCRSISFPVVTETKGAEKLFVDQQSSCATLFCMRYI